MSILSKFGLLLIQEAEASADVTFDDRIDGEPITGPSSDGSFTEWIDGEPVVRYEAASADIAPNIDIDVSDAASVADNLTVAIPSTTWRFQFARNDGDANYLSVREVELRGSVGGADQCSGGTASASTEYSGTYAASTAFDNDTGTKWIPTVNHASGWLQYIFGSGLVDVAQYSIDPDTDYDRAPNSWMLERYDVSLSDWVPVDARINETGWSGARTYESSAPASGTLWRLNISAVGTTATLAVIQEMEMRESVGGADVCTVANGFAYANTVYDDNFWSYSAQRAFDGTSVIWASQTLIPAKLYYCFSSEKDIAQYTIQARNDGGNIDSSPKAWTLEKWTGSAWEVVDTQSDQTGWSHDEVRTYTVGIVGVNVSDTVSVAEDVTVSIAVATELGISVVDAIGIAEDITVAVEVLAVDVDISVVDTISVVEDTVIIVNPADLSINVYSATATAEDVSSVGGSEEVSIIDTISVSDVPGMDVGAQPPIDISLYDEVGVVDAGSIESIGLGIEVVEVVSLTEDVGTELGISGSVYSEVSVADVPVVALSIGTSVVDSTTVGEDVSGVGGALNVEVVDLVSLSEDISFSADSGVSVVDSSSIAEDVNVALGSIEVSVYSSAAVSENVQLALSVAIEVVDAIATDEVSTGLVSDLNVSVVSTVSIAEYFNGKLTYSISVVDQVSVVDISTPVVSAYFISVSDRVRTRETIVFAPDFIISIYDTAHPVDAVYTDVDAIGFEISSPVVVTDVPTVSYGMPGPLDVPVLSSTANVAEDATVTLSDLKIRINENVDVAESSVVYWEYAVGLLQIECEGLVIGISTEEQVISFDCEGQDLTIETEVV